MAGDFTSPEGEPRLAALPKPMPRSNVSQRSHKHGSYQDAALISRVSQLNAERKPVPQLYTTAPANGRKRKASDAEPPGRDGNDIDPTSYEPKAKRPMHDFVWKERASRKAAEPSTSEAPSFVNYGLWYWKTTGSLLPLSTEEPLNFSAHLGAGNVSKPVEPADRDFTKISNEKRADMSVSTNSDASDGASPATQHSSDLYDASKAPADLAYPHATVHQPEQEASRDAVENVKPGVQETDPYHSSVAPSIYSDLKEAERKHGQGLHFAPSHKARLQMQINSQTAKIQKLESLRQSAGSKYKKALRSTTKGGGITKRLLSECRRKLDQEKAHRNTAEKAHTKAIGIIAEREAVIAEQNRKIKELEQALKEKDAPRDPTPPISDDGKEDTERRAGITPVEPPTNEAPVVSKTKAIDDLHQQSLPSPDASSRASEQASEEDTDGADEDGKVSEPKPDNESKADLELGTDTKDAPPEHETGSDDESEEDLVIATGESTMPIQPVNEQMRLPEKRIRGRIFGIEWKDAEHAFMSSPPEYSGIRMKNTMCRKGDGWLYLSEPRDWTIRTLRVMTQCQVDPAGLPPGADLQEEVCMQLIAGLPEAQLEAAQKPLIGNDLQMFVARMNAGGDGPTGNCPEKLNKPELWDAAVNMLSTSAEFQQQATDWARNPGGHSGKFNCRAPAVRPSRALYLTRPLAPPKVPQSVQQTTASDVSTQPLGTTVATTSTPNGRPSHQPTPAAHSGAATVPTKNTRDRLAQSGLNGANKGSLGVSAVPNSLSGVSQPGMYDTAAPRSAYSAHVGMPYDARTGPAATLMSSHAAGKKSLYGSYPQLSTTHQLSAVKSTGVFAQDVAKTTNWRPNSDEAPYELFGVPTGGALTPPKRGLDASLHTGDDNSSRNSLYIPISRVWNGRERRLHWSELKGFAETTTSNNPGMRMRGDHDDQYFYLSPVRILEKNNRLVRIIVAQTIKRSDLEQSEDKDEQICLRLFQGLPGVQLEAVQQALHGPLPQKFRARMRMHQHSPEDECPERLEHPDLWNSAVAGLAQNADFRRAAGDWAREDPHKSNRFKFGGGVPWISDAQVPEDHEAQEAAPTGDGSDMPGSDQEMQDPISHNDETSGLKREFRYDEEDEENEEAGRSSFPGTHGTQGMAFPMSNSSKRVKTTGRDSTGPQGLLYSPPSGPSKMSGVPTGMQRSRPEQVLDDAMTGVQQSPADEWGSDKKTFDDGLDTNMTDAASTEPASQTHCNGGGQRKKPSSRPLVDGQSASNSAGVKKNRKGNKGNKRRTAALDDMIPEFASQSQSDSADALANALDQIAKEKREEPGRQKRSNNRGENSMDIDQDSQDADGDSDGQDDPDTERSGQDRRNIERNAWAASGRGRGRGRGSGRGRCRGGHYGN